MSGSAYEQPAVGAVGWSTGGYASPAVGSGTSITGTPGTTALAGPATASIAVMEAPESAGDTVLDVAPTEQESGNITPTALTIAYQPLTFIAPGSENITASNGSLAVGSATSLTGDVLTPNAGVMYMTPVVDGDFLGTEAIATIPYYADMVVHQIFNEAAAAAAKANPSSGWVMPVSPLETSLKAGGIGGYVPGNLNAQGDAVIQWKT